MHAVCNCPVESSQDLDLVHTMGGVIGVLVTIIIALVTVLVIMCSR